MLNRFFKKYLGCDKGSVATETIWMGVFLTFFFAPTVFLYQISDIGLENSWGQRTAARNEAINDNCSNFEIVLSGVNFTEPDVLMDPNSPIPKSASIIRCQEIDAERDLPANEKFWKRLEKEAQDRSFKDIVEDIMPSKLIAMINGNSSAANKKLSMGGTNTPLYALVALPSLPAFTAKSEIYVPTDDTWVFDEPVWAAGHDKAIHKRLPTSKSKQLYKNVFPSR